MSVTFADELKALIDLVKFKKYKRSGCVLYAKYSYFKPECTITELVWGFCRNPCYARKLARELSLLIPDYAQLLGKANTDVAQVCLFPTFDYAMRRLSTSRRSNEQPQQALVFSSESTNPLDMSNSSGLVFNATDEDGEIWCGLAVPSEKWTDNVESIKVSIFNRDVENPSLLWQCAFSNASVVKRVKKRNDVVMFQPFKHALPLLDLNFRVQTIVNFRSNKCDADSTSQIFGILSNAFCDWLQESSLQIKLCKNSTALINMPDHTIEFTI